MKKSLGILLMIGIGLVVLGGCHKAQNSSQKPGEKSKAKTVRMDTVLQKPRHFESIHQMELREHESAGVAGDTTLHPKP